MEALSTSVSTLRVAGRPSTAREHHLIRPATTQITSQSHLSNKPNSSFSLLFETHLSTTTKSTFSFTSKKTHFPFLSSSPIPPLQPTKHFHRTAASGYAAALLDIARCNNDIDVVEKDVQRFSRLLHNDLLQGLLADPTVEMEKKGEVLKEVGLKGGFHKHVVVLVKMMVEKGKVGLVGEMLEEFKRICDEVRGTKVVLVSSAKRMGEEELLGIAKKVQKMSGAMKVKVRHVVDESLPVPTFLI